MQPALRLLLASAALALPVLGAPCVSGTLQDYINLGATGCTVSGSFANPLLSSFSDQSANVSFGATAIDPLSVSVTPLFGGLRFTTTQTASSGTILESFLRFVATGANYGGVTLTLSGASATADAAVNGIFDGCGPQSFSGPGGTCGGSQISLAVTQLESLSQLTDSRSFAPALPMLDVFVSLALDGGASGLASGATLDVTFTDVPEPAAGAVVLSGIAAMLLARRYRSVR